MIPAADKPAQIVFVPFVRICISLFLAICILSACENSEKPMKVCFTGDLLLDRGVRKRIESGGIDQLLENVKPLFSASDFVIANLECPATDIKMPITKRYVFRAEPEWLGNLGKSHITHLVMANNHAIDQRRDGLTDTGKNIKINGLIPIGYGTDHESACEPALINKAEVAVAVFSSVLLPLENWMFLPDSACICQKTAEQLAISIRNFRVSNPDHLIFVSLHWGGEFEQYPEKENIQNAHLLIDAGADAIIGHHPHVIQSVEYYKNKPILYSLGNFIFDQKKELASMGLIAEFLVQTRNDVSLNLYPIKISDCIPLITSDSVFNSAVNIIEEISQNLSFIRYEDHLQVSQKN